MHIVSRAMAAALIGLTIAASAASAQAVDRRHGNQQDRIANGVANGQLTPGEAARVERQQGRIDRAEARDRARDGGHLTAANRAHLRARENRASAHIHRAKHNARGY